MYYPILFHIGKLNFYTHGLMVVIGAILGGAIIYYLAKAYNKRTDFIFDLIVFALLGGLIGARILYVILYYNQFASFQEVFFIWYGGLVSYGGIIGGLVASYFLIKSKKDRVYEWFDIGAIGLFADWAIGRIGCFLTNDSLGLASVSRIAVEGRLPVTLFESIWSVIVAVGAFIVLKKRDKLKLPDGVIFWGSIGLYAIGRFVIDFYRAEDAFVWGLNTGQVGSLVILVTCIINILILIRGWRKKWF